MSEPTVAGTIPSASNGSGGRMTSAALVDRIGDLPERKKEAAPRRGRERAPSGDALPDPIRASELPPAPPMDWLVKGFIPANEITMFVGPSGVFKTGLAVHVAAAVAGGYPVLGRDEPVRQRPVLYVSAEDPASLVEQRLRAFAAGHGWDASRILGNVFIYTDERTGEQGISIATDEWQAKLHAVVRDHSLGLVVLDPLADLITGEENSASEQRPTIKFLRSLTRQGASVLMNHHAGKGRADKTPLDRIRGSSAYASAARAVFSLDDDGNRFVAVENPKMSRVAKLPPFAICKAITTDPAHPGDWTEARLSVQSGKRRACDLVYDWIGELGGNMGEPRGPTSTALREHAKGKGLSGEQVSAALTDLQDAGRITFVPGARNAKYWQQNEPAVSVRQARQATLPNLPASSNSPPNPNPELAPYGGGKLKDDGGGLDGKRGDVDPGMVEL